jgi:hypothetical protein
MILGASCVGDAAVSALPNSTNLILLQRKAYIEWMAIKKTGNLRSEISLLQYFADELIAAIFNVSSRPTIK